MDDFTTDDLADLGVADLLNGLDVPVLLPADYRPDDFADEG